MVPCFLINCVIWRSSGVIWLSSGVTWHSSGVRKCITNFLFMSMLKTHFWPGMAWFGMVWHDSWEPLGHAYRHLFACLGSKESSCYIMLIGGGGGCCSSSLDPTTIVPWFHRNRGLKNVTAQVWRWMSDGDTNLRTMRLRAEKLTTARWWRWWWWW